MGIRKIKSILLLVTLFMFNSCFVFAATQNHGVHTWHVITSKGGTFNGSLQVINEKATFVKPDGTPLNTFILTPEQPVKFGFSFDPNDDFDVAYTLTLTEQDSFKHFVSKTCLFVITAKGPAQPDVRYFAYNGATCSSTVVKGVGEDFSVS